MKEKLYEFFEFFDMFGREAKLYYKGKEKKGTIFGIICSFLYLLIYGGLLTYKLVKMFKKKNVTFYESSKYIEKPPTIKLSEDIFYGGFGLERPDTYDPFIDETIYYPKAFYKVAIRNGDLWNWTEKEIGLEKCSIEKFGKNFRSKFNNNALKNLYCFKEMNETFIGHFSYDYYSFFFIQLFQCVNTTENNNHCKSIETIDKYLKNTFVCMEFEDVELTPDNYSFPVRERNQDIYFTVGKKLFKEIHIFYQITIIETDLEFIGIEDFEKYDEKKYLKYHSTNQMSNIIENDIYETGEAFCQITIKLYDQVKTQRRIYTKLISIWGDVGGLMEVIKIFLLMISSFSIDTLYEITTVNNSLSIPTNIKKHEINRILYKLFNNHKQIEKILNKNDVIKERKKINIPNKFYCSKAEFDKKEKKKFNPYNNFNNIINNNEVNKSNSNNNYNNLINNNEEKKINLNNNYNYNYLCRLNTCNICCTRYINNKESERESIQKAQQDNTKNEDVYKYNKKLTINESIFDIYKRSKKNLLNEIKKNKINIHFVFIYFLCCFLGKRSKNKNNKEYELNKGMDNFKQQMDIFKIYEKMVKFDKLLKGFSQKKEEETDIESLNG